MLWKKIPKYIYMFFLVFFVVFLFFSSFYKPWQRTPPFFPGRLGDMLSSLRCYSCSRTQTFLCNSWASENPPNPIKEVLPIRVKSQTHFPLIVFQSGLCKLGNLTDKLALPQNQTILLQRKWSQYQSRGEVYLL